MLRAVIKIYIEARPIASRDIFKIIRVGAHSKSTASEQTVVSSDGIKSSNDIRLTRVPPVSSIQDDGETSQPPPPRAPPPSSRRTWSAVAALSITASLGGVYLYRKYTATTDDTLAPATEVEKKEIEEAAVPPTAADLPAHAQYLLVGGGTAAFAAMRAIRSARPDAQVLMVSAEHALPYMRPPLSKELWREPGLAAAARRVEELTFRQWNGRRRSVLYEPAAFYTPPERLRDAAPGAGVARGWTALRLDPERHTALLQAPGQLHTLTYDKCLIATGLRPRRLAALRPAAAAGRSLALRTAADAARVAAALDRPDTRTVLLVGGGFLAVELAAALADRVRGSSGAGGEGASGAGGEGASGAGGEGASGAGGEGAARRVVLLCREEAPLAGVLPPYLAADAARRLAAAGVTLMPRAEVTGSSLEDGRVLVRLASGAELAADLVLECVGAEPDPALALASGLELHDGAVLVNAELQARTDLFAAGDAASFHSPQLGRRRVEHHDHAVLSGRRAGENMVGDRVRPYDHHSMYWSDIGQQLGYEAIGITDSQLRTVGVFSSDAVADERVAHDIVETVKAQAADREEGPKDSGLTVRSSRASSGKESGAGASSGEESGAGAGRRYERGVVFYLRDERVVGVLLWNLFNRMQVARQVLSHGKFDDLFEVAKLFSLHEED